MPTSSWYPVADTYLHQGNSSSNYGGTNPLYTSAYSPGDGSKYSVTFYEGIPLIRFFNSNIAVVSVSSASITLTGDQSYGSVSATIYRATGNSSWGENTITYSSHESVNITAGGSIGSYSSIPANTSATISLDATAIMGMMTGDRTGISIVAGSASYGGVLSKESSNGSAYWPTLTVTYVTNVTPTITLNTPADGATLSTETPTLQALVTDPEAQAIRANIEVYSNASLTTVVHSNENPVGTGPLSNTAYNQAVGPLADGTYWWRAYATDGQVNSGWTAARSFTVVTRPTAPTSLNVNPNPVSFGSNAQVSWTHNDPNGSPQAQYQIRWRKAD